MSDSLPRKAKGERPVYLGGEVDTILSIVLALAGEVSVLRDRLDTAERLLDRDGTLQEAIDAYRPDPDVARAREAMRARFLDIVMRPIHQQREGLEREADAAGYAQHIAAVEGD